MEIRNACRTVDSREMDSKGLEDKGTTKCPLPFLIVVAISLSVQEAKILEMILCEFYAVFIGVHQLIFGITKPQDCCHGGGPDSIVP